jgi:hypothetical protein
LINLLHVTPTSPALITWSPGDWIPQSESLWLKLNERAMVEQTGNHMLDKSNQGNISPESSREKHPEYGHWDNLGLPIRSMVYWTNYYVVYINQDCDIDFRMEKEISPNKIAEFNRILNEASSLETSVSDEFPPHTKIQCKELIGEAIACCLDEDYLNAAIMLRSARTFVEARSRELSRMWFVTGCYLVTAPILIIECVIWFFRPSVTIGIGSAAFWLILCAGAGSLGALLSVISRSGGLQFDASSGKLLHYFEGSSKIIAGAISGVVVGIAVKSGLILTPLFQGGKEGFILLLSAVAAGSAERFAASIISNVSSLGLGSAKSVLSTADDGKQKPLDAKHETKKIARRRSTSP